EAPAISPLMDRSAEGLDPARSGDLQHVIETLRPSVLIGTSGQPGAFSESAVRAMAAGTPTPVIFPLSNPTSKSEATPAQLFEWTEGRALVATGSPFDSVLYKGSTLHASQCNNVYIFPGVGLGSVVSETTRVPDRFFTIAAEMLAQCVNDEELAAGKLFPALTRLREVSERIAVAIASESKRTGTARAGLENVEAAVRAEMWFPEYPELVAG
nr:malic enzyme-like NAD(P)-binding protein [Polyangiaceae bacterium]